MSLEDKLAKAGAAQPFSESARNCPDLVTLWERSTHAPWIAWLASRCDPNPEEVLRQTLELLWPTIEPFRGELPRGTTADIIREAFRASRSWAEGATTREEMVVQEADLVVVYRSQMMADKYTPTGRLLVVALTMVRAILAEDRRRRSMLLSGLVCSVGGLTDATQGPAWSAVMEAHGKLLRPRLSCPDEAALLTAADEPV